MQHDLPATPARHAAELLAQIENLRRDLARDPFGNPVLSAALAITRAALESRILRLEISPAMAFLAEVFPRAGDPAEAQDFAEPPAPRATAAYAREHAEIFQPIARYFDLIREIGTTVAHEVGAFG